MSHTHCETYRDHTMCDRCTHECARYFSLRQSPTSSGLSRSHQAEAQTNPEALANSRTISSQGASVVAR